MPDCEYGPADMTDYLANAYPVLAERLQKLPLADLPTPITGGSIRVGDLGANVDVKRDDMTSSFYGGNKLRKLEYLLQRAHEKNARCVATFGSVASNHALATTLYAERIGLPCICLLSHQTQTPATRKVLGLLLQHGAEIVCYWGNYRSRIQTMRQHVQGRHCDVIPLGGTSWLGTVGYVNAGLEFAAQVAAGDTHRPDRIYIATGTMGSAAGLALGLALAGLDSSVQAVRVSPSSVMNEDRLLKLMNKTALMLNRIDPCIPADLARRTNIETRHEFFGEGYARSNAETDRAVEIARDQLQLNLETTYTGKAMAALVHDIKQGQIAESRLVFWNTYNSSQLPNVDESTLDLERLPSEFGRYFD
jgi:D-cysteine desulfhydrase